MHTKIRYSESKRSQENKKLEKQFEILLKKKQKTPSGKLSTDIFINDKKSEKNYLDFSKDHEDIKSKCSKEMIIENLCEIDTEKEYENKNKADDNFNRQDEIQEYDLSPSHVINEVVPSTNYSSEEKLIFNFQNMRKASSNHTHVIKAILGTRIIDTEQLDILKTGTVILLNKETIDLVDLEVGDKKIAKGEIVSVQDQGVGIKILFFEEKGR